MKSALAIRPTVLEGGRLFSGNKPEAVEKRQYRLGLRGREEPYRFTASDSETAEREVVRKLDIRFPLNWIAFNEAGGIDVVCETHDEKIYPKD